MKEFRKFQDEVNEWAGRNFPSALPHMPLLGLAEETGELSHAHLKGEQGIRHSKEEIYKMKKDAVGDIAIFLANYCGLNNLDLQDCIDQTWEQVKLRDWQKNAMSGIVSTNEFKPFGVTLGNEIELTKIDGI